MFKSFMNSLRKRFIQFQVSQQTLPDFNHSKNLRYHVIFKGNVQGVGFRYEVYKMAERLRLTGWVKNLVDSSVEAEIQGPEEKLDYLLDFIENHKRINVDDVDAQEIDLVDNEEDFEIVV